MLMMTHISHGVNGKNIGLLTLSIIQDPASSMICTRKFSRNVGADFTCEHVNEELKMRITYSHLTMQNNSSRITMKNFLLHASNIVHEPSNRMIDIDSASTQGFVF